MIILQCEWMLKAEHCDRGCWWTAVNYWCRAKGDIRRSPTQQWFSRAPKSYDQEHAGQGFK